VFVALVGQGPGRGIALPADGDGCAIVGWAVAGYAYPRLRHLDDELPDMAGLEPSAPTDLAPVPTREPGGNDMTPVENAPAPPGTTWTTGSNDSAATARAGPAS